MTGIFIKDGVPYIWGEKAIEEKENSIIDTLSNWRCPFCEARLAKDGFICLNACHLTRGTTNRLKRRGFEL